MRKLHVVTNSELETFRLCDQRHGFAYQELLRPRVDGVAKPSGSVLHDGIEAGWRAAWAESDSLDGRLQRAIAGAAQGVAASVRKQIVQLSTLDGEGADAVIAALESEADTLSWCAQNYFNAVRPDLAYVPIFIEAEFTFSVPTARGNASIVEYRGKRDLVLWDRECNRLIVQDHKGTARGVRELERKLPLDTQLSGYVYALQRKLRSGEFIAAVLEGGASQAVAAAVTEGAHDLLQASAGTVVFNVIRRARPNQPKLNLLKKAEAGSDPFLLDLLRLQDEDRQPRGAVSVAECDTTADVYAAALVEQVARGIPISDRQREEVEKLKARGDTFFAQLEYYRDADELERWRREVLIDAERIRAASKRPRTRNPGACSMPWSPPCPYATLCLSPADPVARAQYVTVDRPHQELVENGNNPQEKDYI